MRKEVEERGISCDGLLKPEMRGLLDRDLSGIKRPPALMCGTQSIPAVITCYEIAQLEPLHDLKTMIGRRGKLSIIIRVRACWPNRLLHPITSLITVLC